MKIGIICLDKLGNAEQLAANLRQDCWARGTTLIEAQQGDDQPWSRGALKELHDGRGTSLLLLRAAPDAAQLLQVCEPATPEQAASATPAPPAANSVPQTGTPATPAVAADGLAGSGAASQVRHGLLAHRRKTDLAALLLFLACDAVLLLHDGTELDVAWLGKLRLLQSAKQALYAKRAQLPVLLQTLLALPPPLLLAVLQCKQLTAPSTAPGAPSTSLSAHCSARLRAILKRTRPVGGAGDPWALCTPHPKQPAVVLPPLCPSAAQLHDTLLSHLLGGASPLEMQAAGAPLDTGCDMSALLGMLQEHMREHATSRPGTTHGSEVESSSWIAQTLQQLEDAWGIAAVQGGRDAASISASIQLQPSVAPYTDALLPAVQMLEAASDQVYKLSKSMCSHALQAARQAYLSGLPATYPLRVHRASVRRAAALLATSAHGPAMGDILLRLRQECDALWAAGRQQCGALSCTGRSCGLPHAHQKELGRPHMGAAMWLRADPTGTVQLQVVDPFNLLAANDWGKITSAGRIVQDEANGSSSSRVVATEADPSGTPTDKVGSSGRAKRGSDAGEGTSGTPAGKPNGKRKGTAAAQGSAPQAPQAGLGDDGSFVQTLDVVVEGEDGGCFLLGPWATLSRLGPASRYDDKAGLKQPGLSANHLYPLVLGGGAGPGGLMRGLPRQQLQVQARAGRAGPPGRRQAGGRGREKGGDVEGASDSGEEGMATTDEVAFPSLSAAIAQTKVKQQAPAKQRKGGDAASRHTDTAAQEELAMLQEHWPVKDSGEQQSTRTASGSSTGSTLTVYIAYEYEALDGRRFFATPQQLGSSQKETVLRQGTFSAGSGAASSGPARFLLTHDAPLWLELPPRSARHLSQLTPLCVPAALKTEKAGGMGGEGSGSGAGGSQSAQDVLSPAAVANAAAAADGAMPLPMRPPQLAQLQRIFVCTPSTAHARLACKPVVTFNVTGSTILPDESMHALIMDGAAALRAGQMSDAAAVPLVSRTGGSTPPVSGSGAGDSSEAGASTAARMGTAAGASGDAAAVSAPLQPWSSFKVTLAQECILPPDSLCVLCMPYVYAAPLFAVGPSLGLAPGTPAAAAAAAAQAQLGDAGLVGSSGAVVGAAAPVGMRRALLAPVFPSIVDAQLLHGSLFVHAGRAAPA